MYTSARTTTSQSASLQTKRREARAGELGIDHPAYNSCSTGWHPLRGSSLPVTQLVDHRPSLPTDMLERILFCLGHCLAGNQKDRFSFGNGIASAVASAVCRGQGTEPRQPEKSDPLQWWKTALTIALLREEFEKCDLGQTWAGKSVASTYPASVAAPRPGAPVLRGSQTSSLLSLC